MPSPSHPIGQRAQRALPSKLQPPRTPDARYIVVRDRLWRASNPALSDDERKRLTNELMAARRAVATARRAADPAGEKQAHEAVDRAKVKLGERGPVWWTDGAPDLNRHLIKNIPYAEWYAATAKRP